MIIPVADLAGKHHVARRVRFGPKMDGVNLTVLHPAAEMVELDMPRFAITITD